MKCENIQFNLSLYIDDILTDEERAVVEAHLGQCPLCRQKRDDYIALRQSLRRPAMPAMPKDLLASVKTAMAAELAPAPAGRRSFLRPEIWEFLQMRVMPYAVGTVASLLFALTLLWLMFPGTSVRRNQFASTTPSTVMLTESTRAADDFEITPDDLVAERISVSSVSPSINPRGALIALAQSFTGTKMKGDEVVVVADVLSSGLANIEEVVEPLDNEQTVSELERALEKNSKDAPFVPAFLDKRADSVRVVFKIQRVDVKTTQTPVKKRR
jgi:hypothetical protein